MAMKQESLTIDYQTKRDMQLEIKFKKKIKMILAEQFIIKDRKMDLEKGTDFLIVNINPFKVGVRLRRYKYYVKNHGTYRNQFTIRWKRPTGVATEIDKIREGYVDYILYGFVDELEQHIIQYFIGDLKIFRKNEPKPLCTPINRDRRRSQLAAYELSQFPDEFIVDQRNLPQEYNKKIPQRRNT